MLADSLELPPPATSATEPVLTFKARVNNPQSYLSNFYPFVKNVEAQTTPKPANQEHLFVHPIDGAFLSVEHMYQWRKMAMIDFEYASSHIRHAATPVLAKQLSSKKKWVDATYTGARTKKALGREYDDKVLFFRQSCMLTVMRTALRLKFEQNDELKSALLSTKGCALAELGRTKRDFWAKTGSNMLGRLLVELRDSL